MQPPKYRFYLNSEEIFPEYKNLKKKLAKSDGNIFFKESLEGDLYLYNLELVLGRKNELTIQTYVNGEWKDFFKGKFSKTDCEIDYDRGQTKIKLSSDNDYDIVLDKQENTYNLLDLPIATKDVSIDKRPMLQIYIPGSDSIGCFISNIWFEQECNVVDDENELINTYHFAKSSPYYQYIELSGDGTIEGALPEDILTTFYGTIGDEELVSSDEYGATYERHGTFKSVSLDQLRQFAIDIVFTRYNSYTDIYASYAMSSYKLYAIATHTVCFSAEFSIGNGYNIDYNRWLNDTFTMSPSISQASGTLNAALYARSAFSRWVCDKETYDGSPTYEIPYEDIVTSNRNYRRCLPWTYDKIIAMSPRMSAQPTKWGRTDNTNYYYMPPDDSTVYFPISRSIWGNVSFWHNPNYDNSIITDLTDTYTMHNAYDLASCISALLKKMGADIKHEATIEYSTFLYSETNPVVNEKFEVLITQKTNILKGEYDQPAQRAEISFKELMNMLQQCFMCYWFIDGNKLRIEHISWFLNGGGYSENNVVGIDLTSLKDTRTNRPLSYAQSKVSYNKDELSARFEFSWNESCSAAFEGKSINVNADYVQSDKVESINPGNFVSDVDLMLLNPSNFSEDGFALLGPILTGGVLKLPYVIFLLTDGELSYSVSAQNGYMSWAFLEIFYMWSMPASDIEIEGVSSVNSKAEYVVRKLKNTMTQSVKFPYTLDIDTSKLIKTFIGEGQIDSLTIDMNTSQIEATLLFEPK